MNKLKNIISEYSGIPASNIKDDMSIVGDISIDSFGLISLLCNIEDEFEVSIPENELSKFQTLKDLSSYLASNSTIFN